MKSPSPFGNFDAAMKAIQSASTKDEVLALVDQVDAEFTSDTLQMTPENWGALASAVLIRGDELAAYDYRLPSEQGPFPPMPTTQVQHILEPDEDQVHYAPPPGLDQVTLCGVPD